MVSVDRTENIRLSFLKLTILLIFHCRQSRPSVKPHFFLAHDWGYVMDLKWVPIPVQYAKKSPPPPLPYVQVTDEDQKMPSDFASSLEFHPAQVDQLVNCVVGHLIVACTDGFVRIFPIPHHDNRKRIAEDEKLVIPTTISVDGVPQNVYKLKPNGVLRLAPGTGKGKSVLLRILSSLN